MMGRGGYRSDRILCVCLSAFHSGSGIDISNTSVPFLLPGVPGNLITDYPEGCVLSRRSGLPRLTVFNSYNASISGPSGNITVNGTSTFGAGGGTTLSKRGLGAAGLDGADVNFPPYAIHNGNPRLSDHTLAPNATHAPGYLEIDTHNLWGLMEEKVGVRYPRAKYVC